MNIVKLENDRPVWIAGALRIECVAGRVWLTRTGDMGDMGDIFLHAGDVMVLVPGDRVLAEGLGTAHVKLIAVPSGWHDICRGALSVLSFSHERLRTVRFARRRTPLAG